MLQPRKERTFRKELQKQKGVTCAGRLTQRDRKPVTETLKMVRRVPEEESIEESDLEGQGKEQVDVSSIFRKLSLEHFDTSDSDETLATEEVNLRKPNRKHLSKEEENFETEGQINRETLHIPGEQTDGLACCSRIQEDATALRVNRRRGGDSTTARKFTDRLEESSETLEESLAMVNFSKMTKTREPY